MGWEDLGLVLGGGLAGREGGKGVVLMFWVVDAWVWDLVWDV